MQENIDPLNARLIALEEWAMHTNQLIQDLDEVICRMQARLDGQDRKMKRLSESLELLKEGDDEQQRTLEDERPPHY